MVGNAYLNFFLSGAVEIPGYAVAQLSIAYLGRRYPLCGMMAIAGIALICTMVVPDGQHLNTIRLFSFHTSTHAYLN